MKSRHPLTVLIFLTAVVSASIVDSGVLSQYVRALQAAEGLDVRYTVSAVGGAVTEYRVVLSRPNRAMIDSGSTTTYLDGRNVTVFNKSSKAYTVKPQSESSMASVLADEHFVLWRPYFDGKAFDSFASTKSEGTRVRKGETLNLISAQLDSTGKSSLRLHLGQRDHAVRQAELTNATTTTPSVSIVTVESHSTTKVADDAFVFIPPNGSKLLTDNEQRIAEYTKMIKVERTATSLPSHASVTFKPVTAERQGQLDDLLVMVVDEFSKYPLDFIKASKLKQILIVDQLHFSGDHRAAVPAAWIEAVIYDVSFTNTSTSWYMHYVIHHEFFHNLEEEWSGDFYYKDPKWAAMNEADFKYGNGGSSASPNDTRFTHPRKGFINRYSMTGMEEDRADIWAAMMVPEIWKMVAPMVAQDPILQAKVKYLREFARKKCPEMDDAYWKRVSGD